MEWSNIRVKRDLIWIRWRWLLYCTEYIIYYILYYKLTIKLLRPIITDNAFSSKYIEYESNNVLSVKEYLDMIKPYLSGIINDYKTQGEWKIYLLTFLLKDSRTNSWLAQSQQNYQQFFDLFKVNKQSSKKQPSV